MERLGRKAMSGWRGAGAEAAGWGLVGWQGAAQCARRAGAAGHAVKSTQAGGSSVLGRGSAGGTLASVGRNACNRERVWGVGGELMS